MLLLIQDIVHKDVEQKNAAKCNKYSIWNWQHLENGGDFMINIYMKLKALRSEDFLYLCIYI